MSNEWFDIAWINFTKAILHGQYVSSFGDECAIEQTLTDEQIELLYDMNAKHEAEKNKLLRSFIA